MSLPIHSRLTAIAAAASALAITAVLIPGARAASDQQSSTNTPSSTAIVAGLDTPSSNESTAIHEIGRTPALLNAFYGFQNPDGTPQPFPSTWVDQVISEGSTPMITWQPVLNSYKTQSVLTSISNGSQDAYITAWAQAAAASHHVLLVRLMHEFNGNWYPWGAVQGGKTRLWGSTRTYPYTNTPAMYVAAYRHVVDLFRRAGATNVQFVWCFASYPILSTMASYYPGYSYVSWPSMDGYNRSATKPQSFSQIFQPGYNVITSLTTRHILVAETASVEFSGLSGSISSKAQWVSNAYSSVLSSFPQIKAVDWFDTPTKGFSYPIDSSSATLNAIQAVFGNSQYQGAIN